MRRRFLLAFGSLGLLAGCGFRPTYMRTASGKPGVAQRELASVDVDIISDRPGQLLRQALQERFDRAASGMARKYDLGVSYSISGEGIAVQPDSTVSRIRLIARGTWTLRAQNPGRTVLASGNARAIDGLNIFQQQYFAADLEQEEVQRRLAGLIADQITLQLAAYFRKQAGIGVTAG